MINQQRWQAILAEAKRKDLPLTKKRAIIREFLQVKFLVNLYRLKDCSCLAFIGGTSLRLLRGLDRFSEDLDFDNFGLKPAKVKILFEKTAAVFKREKYCFEFDFKATKDGGRGRLRFADLFYKLKISGHAKEKLMIKLDFSQRERIDTEVVLLTGFGSSERIVTNTLPVLLAQKSRVLMTRKQTRGRDFYDIYWLLSRGVKPSLKVLKPLGVDSEADFYLKLKKIYQKEEKKMPFYQKQIRPFLINEGNRRYLDFFGELIDKRISQSARPRLSLS